MVYKPYRPIKFGGLGPVLRSAPPIPEGDAVYTRTYDSEETELRPPHVSTGFLVPIPSAVRKLARWKVTPADVISTGPLKDGLHVMDYAAEKKSDEG